MSVQPEKTSKGSPMIPTDKTPPALNFQDAPDMPDAKELAAKKNPFFGKVKELAQTGKAAFVEIPEEHADWARTQIRNAANSIGKGARTKVASVDGKSGVVRVYFTVAEKITRGSKTD